MPPRIILGEHPASSAFGCFTTGEDKQTDSAIPHRALIQEDDSRVETIAQVRTALIKHHASPEMISRDRRIIENLRTLGYPVVDIPHRFPNADRTRKGNLTEIFLAEYLCASSGADLPVYRLQFNPNVEQAMKGDDMLAFDFSEANPRIIVGEAKFRSAPDKVAVKEMIDGLLRSYQGGLPASLQFVADRLYEAHNNVLADRIADCAVHMAKGTLEISYVGLLLSNRKSQVTMDRHASAEFRNLVVISFGMDDPAGFVDDCFDRIEEETYSDSN